MTSCTHEIMSALYRAGQQEDQTQQEVPPPCFDLVRRQRGSISSLLRPQVPDPADKVQPDESKHFSCRLSGGQRLHQRPGRIDRCCEEHSSTNGLAMHHDSFGQRKRDVSASGFHSLSSSGLTSETVASPPFTSPPPPWPGEAWPVWVLERCVAKLEWTIEPTFGARGRVCVPCGVWRR